MVWPSRTFDASLQTNAIFAAFSLIPDGACISDIVTNVADVTLSTAAELAPRSKRPRGTQGWCTGPGLEAEMNAAWQHKEEVRRHLRAQPHNSNLQKAVKMAGQNFRKVRDMATDVSDVMLSTAAELAQPCSKRPCGAQGRCAGLGMEAEMNAAWQQRGNDETPTRTTPHQQPSKGREGAWKKTSEGSQGSRAELFLRLRPQTRIQRR